MADNDYYTLLAKIESSTNPNAKAATSSASGLYQFVKSTWLSLGGKWGTDSTKPFGGATVTVEQQNAMIAKLTDKNESILERAKIAINNATLYAAHFLGVNTAKTVLGAPQDTKISNLVSPDVIKANSFLKGMTVADFGAWLQKKTGTNPFPKAAALTMSSRR